ncbi:unnamed protein product [Urochloa humidicola]
MVRTETSFSSEFNKAEQGRLDTPGSNEGVDSASNCAPWVHNIRVRSRVARRQYISVSKAANVTIQAKKWIHKGMESREGATGGSTASAKKRAADEVVPPAFVAREDEGGAYSMFETPKRFMHGYLADKGPQVITDPRARALELHEAEYTARRLRLIGFVDKVIRTMDDQDAKRAAEPRSSPSI